ncbi:MAG: 3-phosphoserine/phosphohydroxythreonine transaminase [Rikenellaceae bacterium]|jgi:phosphoserine aminotransferase|nr:3-phosphoserine/phosphohydroxythreonine transaminase [Rikenellaceae bacterium]
MKKYNFNAGPSILPGEVIEQAIKDIRDFRGNGLSILEISHRAKYYEPVIAEAESLLRELLAVPENYSIFFLGGGASTQFYLIPFNFLATRAGYVNTGVWSKKAIKEAQAVGAVEVLASSEDKNFTYIPKGFAIPTDLDYLHITTNNTIYGTEFHTDIDSPVPLIADMSSDILSRPVDVSKYAMIYGGAQKNMGPAGAAFVIIRNDMLDVQARKLPAMMQFKTHAEGHSMYNTPPVFTIYAICEVLKWVKAEGGVAAIHKRNALKAGMLYDEIDRNPMFQSVAVPEDRSLMNVCFVMAKGKEELADKFMALCNERGIVGVKGHRLVGGFRASLYNALPVGHVEYLVKVMHEFEKQN